MKISNLLAVAGLIAGATSAQAVVIPGFATGNTGVANLAGGPILPAASLDSDWLLTATTGSPAPALGASYVTSNASFPLGIWLPNSTTSAWITPTTNQGASFDPTTNGTYTYTFSFNLTGFIPSTASFSGQFLADNSATISLNSTLLATATSFSSFTPFTSAGATFNAGLNTITVVATNLALSTSPNPTGIRVEFTNSNVSAVPEPSALLLSVAGLAMVGGLAKRRLANRG